MKKLVSMMTRPKLAQMWMMPKKMPPLDVIVRYEPSWLPDTGCRRPACWKVSKRLEREPISSTVKALAVKKQRMMRMMNVWR